MILSVLENISLFILIIISKIGYFGIFLLMIFQSLNVPIPSEIIMPFSGFLVHKNILNFWLAVLSGAFGNLVGALISYQLAFLLLKNGLREKYKILKFLINDHSLSAANKWFQKYGAFSVFLGRLMPIISTFISFPAGLAKMNLKVFSFFTFIGSFVWCIFLVWLGFIFGENWHILQFYFRKFDYVILILILAAISWWAWKYIRLIQKQKSDFQNKRHE